MTSLAELGSPQDRSPPVKQWNRNHATKRLEDEMKRARVDPNYQFSIVMVEFDGLSDTADRLGYAAEEDIWRRTLMFLLQDLGSEDMCCRLGGDEFLLILPSQGYDDATQVSERLRRHWNPAPRSRQANIQISIGIASYPIHGCSIEQLLCAADQILHASRVVNEIGQMPQESREDSLTWQH